MNSFALYIFAEFENVFDDGLEAHDVAGKRLPVKLDFRLDVLVLFGYQCLHTGAQRIPDDAELEQDLRMVSFGASP